MEFRDLKTQYATYKDSIDRAIMEVVADTHYIGGKQVGELEKKLAEYVGVKHCVTCANGTDALQLALMVWNIGPGDAVFVPDFTFFSTGEVVSALGATPVFVDINPLTFNMSPARLRDAIDYVKSCTDLVPKVIAPVDLFGLPADYDAIRTIAKENDLLILEDGAQGFGGRIGDAVACSWGDIATTSFFPAKPLGCYGDGGAIFTDNDEWAALLKSYKVHGKGGDKYDNVRIGMNSRLDTIQAAVLIEKLGFFDEELDGCNKVAHMYDEQLKDVSGVRIPVVPNGYMSSWAQYTILLDSSNMRDAVIENLKAEGIPAMIYYKKPMHKQTAFEGLAIGEGIYGPESNLPEEIDCPNTTSICDRCVSLPMSAYVKEEEVKKIVDIIKNTVEGND